MSWNDDIKKIMAILPQIEAIQNTAKRPQKIELDDSQIRRDIERLSESVSKIADDLLSIKRTDSSVRTYQELAANFEQDLVSVKSKLDKLKGYDDSAIVKRLSALESKSQPTYCDPKAYDDTRVKTELAQLLKNCEAQNVTIATLSKECGKINKLENLIKSKDDSIKSLKLDLKRAKLSARTCEDLMVSMEQKVNDLSKRLKDGN